MKLQLNVFTNNYVKTARLIELLWKSIIKVKHVIDSYERLPSEIVNKLKKQIFSDSCKQYI